MIVVDEFADSLLVKALESLKANPESTRCIHFKFARAKQHAEEGRELLLRVLPDYFPVTPMHVYLCDDGDIFILAPVLPVKEARLLMMDVAQLLGLTFSDALVELIELNPNIHKVLVAVDEKIARREALERAKKMKLEEESQLRKRQSILSTPVLAQNGTPSQRRHARNKPHMMTIEDDPLSRRLLENVLKKEGYEVTGIGEATYALETYMRLAPDILFLDINLPDVTGHELLEKIVKMDSDSYVVMLSGNADRDNIMKAMTIGARGFVAKPFTREKLLQYIDRCPTLKHVHP
jgi:two-component system, chemotaxis family, chemotaxis protein CheY